MSEKSKEATGGILLPRLVRKPDRNTKRKEMQLALASCMKLFIVIHEALRANGEGAQSPLSAAVAAHAQMCGRLIPNSMRLDPKQVSLIRAESAMDPAPAPSLILPG